MEIQRPSLPGPLPAGEPRALARNWQVGQVLQATVSAAGRGSVELQIGGARVQAETGLPLAAGQRLDLRVIATGERPVLKVLNPPVEGGQETVQRALRTALPRQGGLSPLLASLLKIAGAATTLRTALPQQVLQSVRDLLGSLPNADTLRAPHHLQQALRDSGLFLESRLLGTTAGGNPATDFKAGLLRLVQATGNTQTDSAVVSRDPAAAPPPLRGSAVVPQPAAGATVSDQPALALRELAQQAEGALARLQLHQLASLPVDDAPRTLTWSLELPLRQGERSDVLDLRIQGEAARANAEEPDRWSVWLALDLPGLGPLRALVTLHGEQVAVSFWSERDSARFALDRDLDELRRGLERTGLDVGRLASLAGRPEQGPPPNSGPLLNTTA